MTDAADSSARSAAEAVAANAFRKEILIRFAHCDLAKMVFYPRYFEMFNDLVEDWFREGLQLPFDVLHRDRGWGLPTVHLEVDFLVPGRMGEVLQASLSVREVGKSSINLRIVLCGPDRRDRVRGDVVLVLLDAKTTRAIDIPDDLRARVMQYAGAAVKD